MTVSNCINCKHYNLLFNNCTAYPKGIPLPISNGLVWHTKPYEGDNGIIFEPISKAENNLVKHTHGGPGSGNFGHAGRPGERGGSGPGGASSQPSDDKSYIGVDMTYSRKAGAYKEGIIPVVKGFNPDSVSENLKNANFRQLAASKTDYERSTWFGINAGVIINVRSDGLNDEEANHLCAEYAKVLMDSPEEALRFQNIQVMHNIDWEANGNDKGAMAYADNRAGEIVFNYNYVRQVRGTDFKPYYVVDKQCKGLQERGFWSTPNEDVNGVQYIITHEIGHGAFESTPIIGQTGFNHFDDYCSDHPEEVAKISKYAMYSHEEAKAETYAAIKGGNPKYAKLPIVKQFKREYAKQNGKELR